MTEVVDFIDFKKRKAKTYEDALGAKQDLNPKTVELKKAYDYFEEARAEACQCWDHSLIALALEQIVANQLKVIKESGKKINHLNYILGLGKRVCSALDLQSKVEAQVLLHFLVSGYVDSIKILITEASDPLVIVPTKGRLLICSASMYWDGKELIRGNPSFQDSIGQENVLIEVKNLLDYMMLNAPELAPMITQSPFWIV